MKIIKYLIPFFIIVFLLVFRGKVFYASAEEPTPTPEVTATSTDSPVSPTPEPTLEPTPTELAAPTPESSPAEELVDIDLDNSAVVANNVSSEGNSGDNSIIVSPDPSESPG